MTENARRILTFAVAATSYVAGVFPFAYADEFSSLQLSAPGLDSTPGVSEFATFQLAEPTFPAVGLTQASTMFVLIDGMSLQPPPDFVPLYAKPKFSTFSGKRNPTAVFDNYPYGAYSNVSDAPTDEPSALVKFRVSAKRFFTW